MRKASKTSEVSKLTDADAEQMETQHWIAEALDCDYISKAEAVQLNSSLEEVGRMLNRMMDKADSFCGSPDTVLHEDTVEYFTVISDQ
jgi:four helix bundle protein